MWFSDLSQVWQKQTSIPSKNNEGQFYSFTSDDIRKLSSREPNFMSSDGVGTVLSPLSHRELVPGLTEEKSSCSCSLTWGWQLVEEKGEHSFTCHLQRTRVWRHKRPHNQDPPTLCLPFDLLLPLSYSAVGIWDPLSLRSRNRQGS